MPTPKPTNPSLPQVVPSGELCRLTPAEIKPNPYNPRQLFDEPGLSDLKKNIAQHGVLVPITVFQVRGQTKFSILDGERRFRCVLELNTEGHLGPDGKPLTLPANVVEPPTKVAGLLYMFSIHNFREPWELMPAAIGLKIVMEGLGEQDTRTLSRFTGLGEAQIERCKKLLLFPERFQRLSLDPNAATRIPPNFWIELLPVLDLALKTLPSIQSLGHDTATEKLLQKYRARKIKSVIHFRKVMEAYELSDQDPRVRIQVLRRLEEFFLNPALETRAAFDEFVVEKKRVQSALNACDAFLSQLQQLKLTYTADDDERQSLRLALKQVQAYCSSLEHALEGGNDPEIPRD